MSADRPFAAPEAYATTSAAGESSTVRPPSTSSSSSACYGPDEAHDEQSPPYWHGTLSPPPALGPGLGNTVGLDVGDAKQRRPLQFSGLDSRVQTVRRALDSVRIFDGYRFSTSGPAAVEEWRSAMANKSIQLFAPEIVQPTAARRPGAVGQEIVMELKSPDLARHSVSDRSAVTDRPYALPSPRAQIERRAATREIA